MVDIEPSLPSDASSRQSHMDILHLTVHLGCRRYGHKLMALGQQPPNPIVNPNPKTNLLLNSEAKPNQPHPPEHFPTRHHPVSIGM